ncbi:MAG: hypothetical protein QXO40_02265, partial [Candidatus Aenigmatarchaeota archaeon]
MKINEDITFLDFSNFLNNWKNLNLNLFSFPLLSQRIEILKNEIKGSYLTPSILIFSSELENKNEMKELVKLLKINKNAEIYLFDEKSGEVYNFRDCFIYNIKQLPDELAIKLINSPLFEIVEEYWKEEAKRYDDNEKLTYVVGTNDKLDYLSNEENFVKNAEKINENDLNLENEILKNLENLLKD